MFKIFKIRQSVVMGHLVLSSRIYKMFKIRKAASNNLACNFCKFTL